MKKAEFIQRMNDVMDELKFIRENIPKKDCKMFGLVGYNAKYKKSKNRAMYAEEGMQEQEMTGFMLKAFDTMSLGTRAFIIQSMIEMTSGDMDVENEKQRRKNLDKKNEKQPTGNTKETRPTEVKETKQGTA